MTEGFIGGLRDDLEQAMERYERQSPPRRIAGALHPGVVRPATLLRAAATAALLVAVVLAVRTLAPPTRPARPHVAAVLTIGGTPLDATAAGGALWAGEAAGSIVRIDPEDRRIVARIPVPGAPEPIAGDTRSLWVQTERGECNGGRLLRIDARSGRVLARVARDHPLGELGALAVAGDVAWVERGCVPATGVERVDARGRVTARVAVPSPVDGLAAAPGTLWVLGHDGTVVQIDPAAARIRRQLPRVAPLSDPNTNATNALVADSAGAWVLSTGRGAILRIEGGRVVRRIRVPASTTPLLAGARDGLWIATADRLGADHRLIRIDPGSGTTTATIGLGARQPVALVPSGDQLCVVTGGGAVLFVRS